MLYLSIYTALVKHNYSVTNDYGSTYGRISKKLAKSNLENKLNIMSK